MLVGLIYWLLRYTMTPLWDNHKHYTPLQLNKICFAHSSRWACISLSLSFSCVCVCECVCVCVCVCVHTCMHTRESLRERDSIINHIHTIKHSLVSHIHTDACMHTHTNTHGLTGGVTLTHTRSDIHTHRYQDTKTLVYQERAWERETALSITYTLLSTH